MAWKRIIFFIFLFSVSSEAAELNFKKIADFRSPWGSTFVSNNEILLTEVSGNLKLINIEKKGPCFKKASINTKPAIYPHGIDPESPKNIFADGLLCLKKERKAAKITKPRN